MRPAALLTVFVVAVATSACLESPAAPEGVCLPPNAIAADTSLTNFAYTDDCDGPLSTFGDVYALTLAAQTNVLITQTSIGFSGGLTLFSGTWANRTSARLVFDVVGNGLIGAKAYLPAGSYFIVAGSAEQSGGTYTLSVTPTSSTPCSNEFFNYTVRGADIAGTVDLNDCPGGAASVRQDSYSLWMLPGEVVTVTTTFNKSGSMLWRRAGFPNLPDIDIRALTAGNAVAANFTAPDANDPFSIHIIGEPVNTGTGTYTITVR